MLVLTLQGPLTIGNKVYEDIIYKCIKPLDEDGCIDLGKAHVNVKSEETHISLATHVLNSAKAKILMLGGWKDPDLKKESAVDVSANHVVEVKLDMSGAQEGTEILRSETKYDLQYVLRYFSDISKAEGVIVNPLAPKIPSEYDL